MNLRFPMLRTALSGAFVAALLLVAAGPAAAQEATIRKNLNDRLPNLPKLDEVRESPIKGLYEIRMNESEIYYTDAQGNYLIQGSIIDTKGRRNITEERIEKLNAINFDTLPVKDAFVIKRGNGKRKIAVFEDPNCGYCKRFERDLQKVDNVTVYVYLYPILSQDSVEKAKAFWCAADKPAAWHEWMHKEAVPPAAAATCDTNAIVRNVAFGRKYRITGTPTMIFADGSRVPGALNSEQVEKYLAEVK